MPSEKLDVQLPPSEWVVWLRVDLLRLSHPKAETSFVSHYQFTVNGCPFRQSHQIPNDLRKLWGHVLAASGEDLECVVVMQKQGTVAIPFELEEPIGVRERGLVGTTQH